MNEQTIRAVFAHVEAVRARWDADPRVIAYIPHESYARLNAKDGTIEYTDVAYGYSEEPTRAAIPLVAFTDYEAGVAIRVAELAAQEAAFEAKKEAQERETFARLAAKYGT